MEVVLRNEIAYQFVKALVMSRLLNNEAGLSIQASITEFVRRFMEVEKADEFAHEVVEECISQMHGG